MSLQISKSSDTRYLPVFRRIFEDIPGGVTLKTANLPSDKYEVKEGQLIAPAASGGTYEVVKTAKLTASYASNESHMKVNVKNLLAVGDFLTDGTKTPKKITAITRGSTYDDIKLSAALAKDLATGDLLIEPLASNATANKHAATALLRDTVQVREEDGTAMQNILAGAVIRGTVNESLLPTFATTADKTSLTARVMFV